MIVEFTVGNYLSFKEKTTFSMKTASIKEMIDENTFETSITNLKLVKSSIIYGSNSSGKSNLLSAINFVRRFVLDSAKDTQANENIDAVPYMLSTETDDKSSYFEIVFIDNNIKYRYGFEVNKSVVLKEWLHRTKKITESKLFERVGDEFEVYSVFSNESSGLVAKTRKNALFLSVIAQFNGETAMSILGWFQNLNFLLGINKQMNIEHTAALFENDEIKALILKMLKLADLGFENVKTQRIKINEEQMKGFPKEIVKILLAKKEGTFLINSIHQKFDKNKKPISKVLFNLLKNESQGTIKYFALLGPIIQTLLFGSVIIIDELEARLHPKLTIALIKLFNSKINNPKNAQLICTTHNTILLSKEYFRRDQINIMSKCSHNGSAINTLKELNARNDASYTKDYLAGIYGGIPEIIDINLFDS